MGGRGDGKTVFAMTLKMFGVQRTVYDLNSKAFGVLSVLVEISGNII
jgi:hypothetical protein